MIHHPCSLRLLQPGDLVDVAGTTIGKGFQGGIKRWGFARGLMTHGSKSKREHGAQCNSLLPNMRVLWLGQCSRMTHGSQVRGRARCAGPGWLSTVRVHMRLWPSQWGLVTHVP